MKPLPLITSLSNPAIKQARILRQRKGRAALKLFLVEGLHHVGEALEAGWQVVSLLYSPETLTGSFGAALVRKAEALPLRLQPVSEKVMESLAEKENPQGMIAIVRQRRLGVDSLPAALPLVALVSPQDPGNVGTIVRTIDAVGAGGLLLLDSNLDIYHPTAVRASMGSLFWKPLVHASFPDFLEWASRQGRQLIGTSAHASQDFRGLHISGPWVLLMGSEQKGLSPDQLSACDAAVSLPMRGRVSSLNLAVAAGILLYSLCK